MVGVRGGGRVYSMFLHGRSLMTGTERRGWRLGGRGGGYPFVAVHLLIALVIRPLTTHYVPGGAPFLLLLEEWGFGGEGLGVGSRGLGGHHPGVVSARERPSGANIFFVRCLRPAAHCSRCHWGGPRTPTRPRPGGGSLLGKSFTVARGGSRE